MLLTYKLVSAATAALMLGMGAANISGDITQEITVSNEPVYCEILTTTSRGMTTLEGVLHTDKEISGTYTFKVKSAGNGGNSNIRQGGEFHAEPDEAVTLGKVMLSSKGTSFDATLKISTNAKTIRCSQHIGVTI
ncbi:MAG: hypothetical protein L3J32_04155 [Rhizobiaceae bacterium]|nr:hypothetical protein [Rhizobiaceae bacterium]